MPESGFKQFWNFIVSLLLIYTVLVVPMKVSFYMLETVEIGFTYYLDLVVDFLFGIDIVINFISAEEEPDGTVVKKWNIIAYNYLTGWFAIDFIATFPF